MKELIKKYLVVFFVFLVSNVLFSDAFMKSNTAEIDYQNQIWYLRQNVSLNTTKYQMTSNEMTYYRKDKRFSAKGSVYIYFMKENRKIWGISLDKDSSKKLIQGQPVKVVDKNGEREIFSQILTVQDDSKEKMYIFENQVKMKDKKLHASSNKLVYNEDTGAIDLKGDSDLEKPEEKLKITSKDIQYNEKAKKAQFPNPVFITKKESQITSDQGNYEEEDDLIFLQGNVVYKENKREVRSNKMSSRKEKDEKIMTFEEITKIKEDDFDGNCEVIEYLEKKEYVNLKGNAVLKDEKKKLSIKSSMVSVDKKKDLIYFVGGVYVDQKNKIITGNVGIYDKKTAMMEVKGNALYKKGKDIARAEKVFLNTDNNEVKMYGNLKGIFKTQTKKKGESEK